MKPQISPFLNIIAFSFFLFLVGCQSDPPLASLIDKNDSLLTYQSYGFISPSNFEDNAQRVAANNFGFKHEIVGACVVSDSLVKAVKKHNIAVSNILTKKFGVNWENQYLNKFNQELNREQLIGSIIEKNDTLLKKIHQNEKAEEYVFYEMDPIAHTTKYFVKVLGNLREDTLKDVSFYQLLVDYNTNRIFVVNDKLEYLNNN